MGRWMVGLVSLLVGIVLMSGSARADVVCFRLDPFVDRLRVSAQPVLPEPLLGYALTVQVISRGEVEAFYEMQGTGAAITRYDDVIGVAMLLNHGTDHNFSGNHLCTIHAVLDPTTVSGPYRLQCTGGPNDSFQLPPAHWTPEESEVLQLVFDPACESLPPLQPPEDPPWESSAIRGIGPMGLAR